MCILFIALLGVKNYKIDIQTCEIKWKVLEIVHIFFSKCINIDNH